MPDPFLVLVLSLSTAPCQEPKFIERNECNELVRILPGQQPPPNRPIILLTNRPKRRSRNERDVWCARLNIGRL